MVNAFWIDMLRAGLKNRQMISVRDQELSRIQELSIGRG